MTGLDRKLLLLIGACGLSSLGLSCLALQRYDPPETIRPDPPAAAMVSMGVRWFFPEGPVLLSGPEILETGWNPGASLWNPPSGRSPLFFGKGRNRAPSLLFRPKPRVTPGGVLRFRAYRAR